MKKYLSTIIAVLISLVVAFGPDPIALPLDPIAKGLVVLAVFAGVFSVESMLKRRREEK